MGTHLERNRRGRAVARGLAVPAAALALVAAGPAPSGHADEVKGTCAPSPSYDLQTLNLYGSYESAASVDVSVQACAWTPADQWSFTVVQAAPRGGYAKHGWQVRAWFQNGEATPDYRTVTLKIRVDHCPSSGTCENDIAAFESHYRIYRDHYTRQVISEETLAETGNSHQTWRITEPAR